MFRPSSSGFRDLRLALRKMRAAPSLTFIIILSLTLGIGANTAIFSLVDAVLLDRLPVPNPEQLVILSQPEISGRWVGNETGVRSLFSTDEYEHFRQEATSFAEVFASQSRLPAIRFRMTGSQGEEETARVRLVSDSYFSSLRVEPVIGRCFSEGTDQERVAVLQHDYWKRRFGLDPSVLGRAFTAQGAAFTIIGVMPPSFAGETIGATPDLWIPMRAQPTLMPGRDFLRYSGDPLNQVMWLHIMARLKPDLAPAEAESRFNLLFKRLIESQAGPHLSAKAHQDLFNQSIELKAGARGASSLRSRTRQPLLVLMGLVGLILLLASSNVATLLLVRANTRQREMGVRLALGASRRQLAKQLLTESVTLSAAGAGLGILFAMWATSALVTMFLSSPARLPTELLNYRVLGFTTAVAVATGLFFGAIPALRSLKVDVQSALRQARMAGRTARPLAGKALVVFQVALSLLLLIGAGLFLSTLQNLSRQDLGYDRENLLLARVDAVPAGYEGKQRQALFQRLAERLAALPVVSGVSFSENGLLSGSDSVDDIEVEGFAAQGDQESSARYDQVGPNFFANLNIPILLGRGIEATDSSSSRRVVVINETAARFYFGDANPIGKRIRVLGYSEPLEYSIVGVSRDVKTRGLREEAGRRLYFPILQPTSDPGMVYFLLKTRIDPTTVVATVREAILQEDPNLRISSLRMFDDQVDAWLRQEKLLARLSAGFGVVALLLACIGLFGLVSYSTVNRTNEIGLRMAVGALRRDVAGMVLREALLLTWIGVGVGLPAAWAASRLVAGLLFGLSASDPAVIAYATLLLLASALAAGLVPALRASRVSPLTALRSD